MHRFIITTPGIEIIVKSDYMRNGTFQISNRNFVKKNFF